MTSLANIITYPTISAFGPEIFLAAIGCLVVIADILWKDQKYIITTILIAGGFATLLMCLSTSGSSFYGMYSADGFGAFFKIICILALILTVLLSINYLDLMGIKRKGEYYGLMAFACVGMMILASATDLIVLYLGLELMALSIYCLVGLMKKEKRASEAAIKYLLLGAFASCLYLFGLSYVYGISGTTDMIAISKAMASQKLFTNPAFMLGAGLIIISFAFKVAAAPFHMWTPDAYEGAMTPVTAFMSIGPKAAGFAALGRVIMQTFSVAHQDVVWPILIMAFLTMAIGNITALCQKSVKRMLAYSSIAHAGYALLGFLPGTASGISATMNYLFIYLFMNMGAFAIVILLQKRGVAGELLEDYRGLAKNHPLPAALMLAFMFALTGIPPTAGFIGKFNLFMAVLNAGYTWIVIFAVLFSAISAYFYLRVITYMYMYEPEKDVELAYAKGLNAVLAVALTGVIILGCMPEGLLKFAGGFFTILK